MITGVEIALCLMIVLRLEHNIYLLQSTILNTQFKIKSLKKKLMRNITMNNFIKKIIATGILSFMTVSYIQAHELTKNQILSMPRIQKSINAAVKMAHKLGRAGSYVLVDTHGDILAAYRMPGALPSTFGFSKSKAVTAVALGVPTDELQKKLPTKILENIITTNNGKYVLFPGGYPVRLKNKIIAGIAFGSTIVSLDSNVAEENTPFKDADERCAKAALIALNS